MKIKTKDLKIFIRKNIKSIILFICLICFFEILEEVFHQEIMKRDIIGYNLISNYIISDAITPIAKFITNFGGIIYLPIISLILFIFIKNKKIGLGIFINLCTAALLNFTLKQIIRRPRPIDYRLITESGYSFPSGHTMVSTAFYGFIIYLIYKNVKNKYIKISLISALSILITLIGISRIYLGVHYTSDVLGGMFISISYLMIYINFFNKFIYKHGEVVTKS